MAPQPSADSVIAPMRKLEYWSELTSLPNPLPYKGKKGVWRTPSEVVSIVVHQTDVLGGFGAKDEDALIKRYRPLSYHGLCSPKLRASLVLWPVNAYTYHGDGGNRLGVGWAYDGKFEDRKSSNDTLDVELAKQSFAHFVEVCRKQGAALKWVEAHRQHNKDRARDPGHEIWSQVIMPLLGPLELEIHPDYTTKTTKTHGMPLDPKWYSAV